MAVDLTNVDIYGAYSKHLNMGKKKANTHGGEYWTHCPYCGTGEDRFHVWPYRTDSTITHWCRICTRFGDVVTFVQHVEGLDFIGACEALNIDMGATVSRPKRAYKPNDDEAPTEDWMPAAWAFAKKCSAALWLETGKNALAWLRARGLSDDTIKRAGLGYNAETRFDDKADWAVGYRTDISKVWIPRGVTIPWFIGKSLWKVSIRRPDPDIKRDIARGVEHPAKYVALAGGSNGLYGIDDFDSDKPTIVVEGEFDKLIACQALGNDANVVATGSTAKGRGERWALTLAQSPACLIAYDSDEGGQKAIKEYWSKYLPQSLPWQPWGHDINQMFLDGMDLHEWFQMGLDIATAIPEPEPITEPVPVVTVSPMPAAMPEPIYVPTQAASEMDLLRAVDTISSQVFGPGCKITLIPEGYTLEKHMARMYATGGYENRFSRVVPRGPQATHAHKGCTCDDCGECSARLQLVAYGAEHHWPRLLIRPWSAIPAGETSWRGYAAKHTLSELQLALSVALQPALAVA